MSFVIQRGDGKYVARPGARHSYTPKLEDANQYPNYACAEQSCCGNERIIPVQQIMSASEALRQLTPVYPLVCLNGTSKESLLAMGMATYTSLNESLKFLCEMRPHGRDYQLLSEGAYQIARDQHEIQIRKVREARDAINAYLEAVNEQ